MQGYQNALTHENIWICN